VSILRYLTYKECNITISACRIDDIYIHSVQFIRCFTALELVPARYVDRAEFLNVAKETRNDIRD